MEDRDVVIIGAGIAGMTAAKRLRDLDPLVLEASDRVGGRLWSRQCGELAMSVGAHMFPPPDSTVGQLVTEYGLDVLPITGSMLNIALFVELLRTATVTSSYIAAARPNTSKCPLVTGSKDPGQTAVRMGSFGRGANRKGLNLPNEGGHRGLTDRPMVCFCEGLWHKKGFGSSTSLHDYDASLCHYTALHQLLK